jgi:RNA-directed DNA polymerase
MQTILQAIARKAKSDKNYRFRNLYRLVNEEALIDSWEWLNRKAAPGVDKVTMALFERNLAGNVKELTTKLKEKRYRAKLVRRVHIPKGNGKLRPLGIPAISDKLVQLVCARILTAIWEGDFHNESYGYRPERSAKEAVFNLTSEIQYGEHRHIVEADIKGFFDTMEHEWLLKMLELRIDDRAFIKLIRKWLKAGILNEDGKVIHPQTGTPQGGIISPVLANIYLHYALDLWIEKIVKKNCRGAMYYCRYADDFVCAFEVESDAQRFYKVLGKRLEKFGLSLAEDKTRIIPFNRFRKDYQKSTFEFLGFGFRWGTSRKGKRILKKRTSRERLIRSVKRFSEWCRKYVRVLRIGQIFKCINTKLMGYYNYYGIVGNYHSLMRFFKAIIRILFRWLKRKKKRRFSWKKFDDYRKIFGLKEPCITERPRTHRKSQQFA